MTPEIEATIGSELIAAAGTYIITVTPGEVAAKSHCAYLIVAFPN